MSAESLYYSAFWNDGSGSFDNGHWILAGYSAGLHDEIIVARNPDADMYVASVDAAGSNHAYLHCLVGGLWTHPTGTGRNAFDWEADTPTNGVLAPQLWFEHQIDVNTVELWLPPNVDQIRLSIAGNAERGLWYRSLSYVPPPYVPPPDPGTGENCPPRPEWPYQPASISASFGRRGVLRGARARR